MYWRIPAQRWYLSSLVTPDTADYSHEAPLSRPRVYRQFVRRSVMFDELSPGEALFFCHAAAALPLCDKYTWRRT